jgi:hypothetical protein
MLMFVLTDHSDAEQHLMLIDLDLPHGIGANIQRIYILGVLMTS